MTDSVNDSPTDKAGTEPSTAETTGAKRHKLGWLTLTIAALFGLFFAYDLWEAIENAIQLPQLYAQLESVGLGAREVPWLLIWVGILIPPVAYGVAFLVGLRHNVLGKTLIFVLALAAVAALSLSVNALAVA